jgi:hypothetical protein
MPRHELQQPLTIDKARASVAAVEAAIAAGAIFPLARGEPGRSALTEAAAALGIVATTLRSRLITASRVHGITPGSAPLPEHWLAAQTGAKRPQKRKSSGPLAPDDARPLAEGGRSKTPPTLAEERVLVQLRDQVAALKARIRDLHREALDDDAMRAILNGLARAAPEAVDWLTDPGPAATPTPQAPVMLWADWHMGEKVEPSELHGVNGYSLEIARSRANRVVERAITIARDHGPGLYPGAVVALMGDFVSGGLHPELLATDEAEILPSVLHAADLLAASLTRMADFFGRLYVPAVCGNHGRLTRKPEFKRYTAKNADFMIYEILRGRLAGDSRIRIDFRAENDMHWRVYNLRFAQTHGDMLGVKGGDGIIGAMGPIMRGEIKTGKQMAAIGRDYDILLMGHWHQMLWLPRAIVANSLKGWDEYARLSLRAPPSRPSQPLFFVHPRHGITSQWQVWADEGPAPAEENWISWKE